ncbi:hypothetical protein LXA43DRAFT_977716 [Ganoderma leucocontextum]|nr:hypothetical protein LXA43DRAFT_977716 [Ganoderma leucocontextum]
MLSPEENPVQRLRSTLMENLPYCSGTLDISSRDLVLYYGKGAQTRRIDLSNATTDELDALEKACEPAPFGRNDQTVDDFMLGFDAERAGLTEVVRSFLFHGTEEEKFVRAELYKLNVYGKDSFFKPHQDTPRAENMFGSLVVVLPTPHEGGALVLRHNERQWTFESGELLAEPGAASRVAFVSFFSDVEHEVLPVRSGHRLTVTYNLYFSPTRAIYSAPSSTGLRVLQPSGANTSTVSSALAALLADPSILPEGGTLGFGLQHQYPLPSNPLEALQGWLKGSDGALFRACTEQRLTPLLRIVLEEETGHGTVTPILLTEAVELGEYDLEEDDPIEVICRDWGGVVVFCRSLLDGSAPTKEWKRGAYGGALRYRYIQSFGDTKGPAGGYGFVREENGRLPTKRVDMVTDVTRFNELKSTMVAHNYTCAAYTHHG